MIVVKSGSHFNTGNQGVGIFSEPHGRGEGPLTAGKRRVHFVTLLENGDSILDRYDDPLLFTQHWGNVK